MSQTLFKLILASQSPRRKELLSHLKIAIDIVPADIDEDIDCPDPRLLVEQLSLAKAQATWHKIQSQGINKSIIPVVLAADTTVALHGKIYNKPADISDARRMLQELAGNTHDVFTGFTLMGHWGNTKNNRDLQVITRTCHSRVTFEKIDEAALELYLQSGESLDKAGAYGIQGQSLMFISNIEGAYSNVVGLPLFAVLDELKKIVGSENNWRQKFVLN
jgi:septum formation protein